MSEGVFEIRVKNWERFQHYKDRSPPWIKLYNELLDDYRFARLQDASKLHLVMIWLLASRLENRVPADAEWIAKKINATEPVDIDELVRCGFVTFYDPIAEREQNASTSLALARAPEEGEAETEAEVEQHPHTPREEDELGAWMGVHADVLDRCCFLQGTAERNEVHAQYIGGLRGGNAWKRPDGTSAPEAERPRLFALALSRLIAEGKRRLVSSEFDGALRRVIRQEAGEGSSTSASRSGPMFKDAAP